MSPVNTIVPAVSVPFFFAGMVKTAPRKIVAGFPSASCAVI
jgi:hypothetical protein